MEVINLSDTKVWWIIFFEVVETLTLREKENINTSEGEEVNGDQKPEISGKRSKEETQMLKGNTLLSLFLSGMKVPIWQPILWLQILFTYRGLLHSYMSFRSLPRLCTVVKILPDITTLMSKKHLKANISKMELLVLPPNYDSGLPYFIKFQHHPPVAKAKQRKK